MKIRRSQNRTSKNKTDSTASKIQKIEAVTDDEASIEFHRNGIVVFPEKSERKHYQAFFITDNNREICTCGSKENRQCVHIKKLHRLHKQFNNKYPASLSYADFKKSYWYRVAKIMGEKTEVEAKSISMYSRHNDENKLIDAIDQNVVLVSYISQGPDASRFVERCSSYDSKDLAIRGNAIDALARFTLTESEHAFAMMGVRSYIQAFESSFWYRFAYHCYREFVSENCMFDYSIKDDEGVLLITCSINRKPLFCFPVPTEIVKKILPTDPDCPLLNTHMAFSYKSVKVMFRLIITDNGNLQVLPQFELDDENNDSIIVEYNAKNVSIIGDLVYLKQHGILTALQWPKNAKNVLKNSPHTLIKKDQIPVFLDKIGGDLYQGSFIFDRADKRFRIYKHFDTVQIKPSSINRDWYWISVEYRIGNSTINLVDLWRFRKAGKRFLETADGWLDCHSTNLNNVDAITSLVSIDDIKQPNVVKLASRDIFRIGTLSGKSIAVTGTGQNADQLRNIIAIKPPKLITEISGLTSKLRAYQLIGVQWLAFLFENGFGGLLCDDMGLGKTHQIMAFMLYLLKSKKKIAPFLVVCPTTVLSHWKEKIEHHASGLRVAVYHGASRDLSVQFSNQHVLLTSYGVLRNDIELLQRIDFSIAVFDEAQQIKNSFTLAASAARTIGAATKLILTGTPIENSLIELKALFDLSLPGYLGSDRAFIEQYVKPIETNLKCEQRQQLSELISPFILRRLKKTVLDELPEKIEDIRTCYLSDDQIQLYHDAVSTKGMALLNTIENQNNVIPYMHIFALLAILKQICNHPALLDNDVEKFEKYQSGKWDVFKELITESLESNLKIVVFTQFLGMISIMEKYFTKNDIGFVSLTGKSRNRGKIISRFNQDPTCRVFIGSLKAGGVGIDLVAGSVVIHYDRWWNAATEDQTTDRVYRIGQTRGVQVFKLVTKGTLEEKIATIIEKKKDLMDSIVKEDDSNSIKVFSRDELIELLAFPVK